MERRVKNNEWMRIWVHSHGVNIDTRRVLGLYNILFMGELDLNSRLEMGSIHRTCDLLQRAFGLTVCLSERNPLLGTAFVFGTLPTCGSSLMHPIIHWCSGVFLYSVGTTFTYDSGFFSTSSPRL